MGRQKKPGAAGTDNPNVPVSREAKDALVEWWHRHDKPSQGATVSKLIVWFCRQPAYAQRVILGQVEPELGEAYGRVLRQLANKVDPPGGEPLFGGDSDRIERQGNAALVKTDPHGGRGK